MTNWTVETLNKEVDAELERLPLDMRARFVRISGLIELFGPDQVGMPHIKNIDKKLWEIRVTGRDGIARGIYVTASQKRVVVVHIFIKKTQKTPPLAMATAIRRAKEANLL
jgi:hypothetical protein